MPLLRKLAKPLIVLLLLGGVVAGARIGLRSMRGREIGVCVYADYAFRERSNWQEVITNRFRELNRAFQNTKVQWKIAGGVDDDPVANQGNIDQRRAALDNRSECKADFILSIAGFKDGRRSGSASPFSRTAIAVDYSSKPEQENTRALIRALAYTFGAPTEPTGAGTLMTEPPEGDSFSPKTVALIRELRDYNFAAGIDGLTPEFEGRAQAAIQTAATGGSGNPAAISHRLLGGALLNELRAEQAVVHFRESLKIDPASAAVHAELATALSKLSLHTEALKELAEAVRLDPKNALLRASYAGQLSHEGDSEAAVDELEKAIQLAPNNPVYPTSLGAILSRVMGRDDESIAAYKAALKIAPDLQMAQIGLSRVEAQKQKAESDLVERRQLAQKNPTDAGTQYDLAVAEARTGNLDAAIRGFDKAATFKTTAGRAYASQAMLYYLRKNYTAAWKSIKAARAEKFEPPASLVAALKRKQPE